MQVITRSDLGGAQSVLISLSNYLCQDHEVMVVAGTGDDKLWGMLNRRVLQTSVKYLRRDFSPLKDFIAIFQLIRIYREFKPDIIHLHSSKIGILGRFIFPKKKIIYTVHGFDSIRLAYRYFLPLERIMQSQCKAIVGVCKYDQQHMLAEGIHHNVHYIYNGINELSTEIIPAIKVNDSYKKTILCIARISKQKRFDTFISVAKLLNDYAFLWIGNQEEINDLPENVFCLGNIPNAGIYNKIADLFILPSNYEGLPIVILEAMSVGLPVVASNVGGISEIVIDNLNGFTVENSPELFAEKIEYILENEEVYKKFSKQSVSIFQNELIVEKMVNKYLDLYLS